MNKQAYAALLLVALAAGCGGGVELTAPPGSPSHAVQTLIKSIMDKDIGSYINCMDSKARTSAMQSRAMMPDQFDSMMNSRFDSMRLEWEGSSVVGEEVNGDTAKVTLKHRTGEEMKIDLIKEPGGWKIRLMK